MKIENKEFAYKLYHLEISEQLFYKENIYLRVPGGWVINSKMFVPFDNEFQEFANTPTSERITLRCPECNSAIYTKKNEFFQGNEYYCDNCTAIIKYD